MEVELNLDASSSYVSVCRPTSGWAPKGQRWLVLATRPSCSKATYLTDVPISFAQAFAVAVAGRKIAASGGKATLLDWVVPRFTDRFVKFTVPSSTKSATLSFTLPARITITYKGGEKRSQRLIQSKKSTTKITIKG